MAVCAARARTTADRREILAYLLRGWVSNSEWSDYDYEKAVAKGAKDPDDVRFVIGMLDAGVQPVYDVNRRGKEYHGMHLEEVRRDLDEIARDAGR